jgi:hypothetical protein
LNGTKHVESTFARERAGSFQQSFVRGVFVEDVAPD